MKPGQEVSELRKAGRLEEAYRRGKALLKEHPDDLSLKTSMGWVHYERAKQIVTTAKKSGADQLRLAHDLTGVLREFARLQLPRPNLVLSCLLAQAVKFPTDLEALPGFVMWAGPESFRPEDYQASPRDGKVFPPLLEEVARKTAKVAQKQPSSEIREFALWLLRHALEKAQVQKPEWLRYYEALLLGGLGRTHEAREVLVPFVREKQSEFWAWHALANVVRHEDPSAALSMCARACLSETDPKFLVRAFEDLAHLAHALGRDGIALRAAQESIAVRQKNGWKVSSSLQGLARALSGAEPPTDFRAELQALAKDAQGVILADVPALESNYLGTFEREDGREMVRFAFWVGQQCEEIAGPAPSLLGDRRFIPGQPVTIRVQEGKNRRWILQVEPRPSGSPFDQLERVHGVLEGQREGRALVYLNPDLSLPLSHAALPGLKDLPLGSSVVLGCTRYKDRLHVHYCEKTSPFTSSDIGVCKGIFRLHSQGFGFVDDAFVPPRLASRMADGQQVEATVVRKMDRKKGRLGWTVVAVLRLGESQQT